MVNMPAKCWQPTNGWLVRCLMFPSKSSIGIQNNEVMWYFLCSSQWAALLTYSGYTKFTQPEKAIYLYVKNKQFLILLQHLVFLGDYEHDTTCLVIFAHPSLQKHPKWVSDWVGGHPLTAAGFEWFGPKLTGCFICSHTTLHHIPGI